MAINNVDMQDYEGNSYWTMANPDSISEFTKATTRTNIASGDTHRTIFGKICKFFADLGTSAFSGLANNLTTTAAGYGMDARQGPVIQQKFDQINSNISEVNQNLAQGQIEFDVDAAGKGFYRKRGADTWLPFNRNLVLMNGTASYAYSGVSGTYAALFELDNFDFTNYRQISIKNLSNFSYEVTCGTKVFSSDGTYDISDLMAAKLRVMYHGNVGNPPIQLRIELIP